jgi:hypothetical protein
MVFWAVAPRCLVEVYQRFRGPCCLHHQGNDSSQQHCATTQKTAIFVLIAVRTSNPTNIYTNCTYFTCSPIQSARGSSGSIVSDYGLDDRGLIPDRGRGFSSSPCVQTGSGAHPASYPMGTGGPFPGGKARRGRDADHSSPSSAEVKNE